MFLTALATIILGINEITVDLYDHIDSKIGRYYINTNFGSNYWLAWSAILCGIAILLWITRRYHR
jgi:hypothetical protein